MDSVILKGRKNGYEIFLDANAKFEDNLTDLAALLQRLYQSEQDQKGALSFYLSTGRRLLDEQQRQQIGALFQRYENFQIDSLASDVILATAVQEATTKVRQENIQVDLSVIRSGQEVSYESDVLFLGDLHDGGVLKSTGSIFILGHCAGILHAGFPDRNDAVIIGDLTEATQVRISDTIEIINNNNHDFAKDGLAYINDLHVLDFDKISHLSTLRPKLYRKMEDKL